MPLYEQQPREQLKRDDYYRGIDEIRKYGDLREGLMLECNYWQRTLTLMHRDPVRCMSWICSSPNANPVSVPISCLLRMYEPVHF